MNFFEKVKAYVEKFHMIESGESVVAGVSGGADSVCLLLFLKEYQRLVPFSLYCVHVEHGIRANANEDAEYVSAICNSLGIPFFVYHEDVPGYARENGLSEEEAGRILRYEAFQRTLHEVAEGVGKIAVAHHQSDQAETVLFHLFRGSSIRGMAGMRPVRENIIRPLLVVTREEIEQFLAKQRISYQTDETNLSDEYARNRIRHHILPVAKETINEKAVEHIAQTAEMLSQADDYFTELSVEYLNKNNCLYRQEHEVRLSKKSLLQEKGLVCKYILMESISYVTGKRKDITDAHIEAIRRLLQQNGSKQITLPYGLSVQMTYDTILFTQKKPNAEKTPDFYRQIKMKSFLYEKNETIPQKKYTKWLSYDKIKSECSLKGLALEERTRQPGDYLVIDGQGHRKKLKEYMVEEKIPKDLRNSIPLLTIGSEVLWVAGFRINENYKVSEDTVEILEVQIKEEN